MDRQRGFHSPTIPFLVDRIVGALANLGQRLSDLTVGNILRRHGIPPAPKRKHTTSWEDFIRALQYVAHYHEECNHQGKQNRLRFPLPNRRASGDNGIVRCKERLRGLLKY